MLGAGSCSASAEDGWLGAQGAVEKRTPYTPSIPALTPQTCPHCPPPPAYLPARPPAGGEEVPLDYLRAREVLGVLSEGAEKGFLGGLKGAAGEWERVVKAYEYNRELLLGGILFWGICLVIWLLWLSGSFGYLAPLGI